MKGPKLSWLYFSLRAGVSRRLHPGVAVHDLYWQLQRLRAIVRAS